MDKYKTALAELTRVNEGVPHDTTDPCNRPFILGLWLSYNVKIVKDALEASINAN